MLVFIYPHWIKKSFRLLEICGYLFALKAWPCRTRPVVLNLFATGSQIHHYKTVAPKKF